MKYSRFKYAGKCLMYNTAIQGEKPIASNLSYSNKGSQCHIKKYVRNKQQLNSHLIPVVKMYLAHLTAENQYKCTHS